ncbi:hypothetical protein BU16DRAFT_587124 [Lophium mytilinum]|uniref:Dipeptidyl-peptidase V n=1 Tax=Lophium mytilinum TaxID=390894 RepID=A0A6A6Q7U2_9PEZI|nr:hypothetical protein BU16DRAFT_587124 [Lophium mytilinum]
MVNWLSIFAIALLCARGWAITPEQMLSAPRRSGAVPNPTGEYAIFSASSYSFEKRASSSSWNLLHLKNGSIQTLDALTEDVSEVVWISGSKSEVIYVNATNEEIPGGVTLWLGDLFEPSSFKLVASLPGAFSGLKVSKTHSGDLKFLINALAYPNGTIYNAETASTPKGTGRLYSDTFVRHWDFWLTPERYALFSGTLKSKENHALSQDGVQNRLTNLNYTVTRPETPVQPFGDEGDYDLSPDGKWVAFLSKAPELAKANYTASYIYLVPFDSPEVAPIAINGPGTPAQGIGALGASAGPRFSPDSSKIAFLQQDGISYESDKSKVYVAAVRHSAPYGGGWSAIAGDWDRSVDSLAWNPDGKSLLVSASDLGEEKLFTLPIDAPSDYEPRNFTTAGTNVADFHVLPDSSVLVSGNSIWSSRDFYIKSEKTTKYLFSATTTDPELEGLSSDDVEQFYFIGALGIPIQSWIIKPKGFQANATYPLAFIVHGGPQGYVVIAPNPTGSSGWGQFLQDSIQNQWGGHPYDDLVKAWDYIEANLTYIDTDRAVELGASYGGYMTNWIQGHDLGRKFKALVAHDGLVSTLGAYATEELWFTQHEYNGTLWDNRENYERWDPAAHIKNFSTPQFIIHSSEDYRLPETEGITMFNYLQSRGVPSRFLSFPNENHWVLKPENSLQWHENVLGWINHYSGIGGPLSDDAIGS